MYTIRAMYNGKANYWSGSTKGFWSTEKLLAKQYTSLKSARAKKSTLLNKFQFINNNNIFIDLEQSAR